MKLLIVAPWFPSAEVPHAGSFISDLAEALADVHEVLVVAPEIVASKSRFERQEEEGWPFKLVRLKIPASHYGHFLDYSLAIAKEVRANKCDLIHVHVTIPTGFGAVMAGLFTGKPVIITEHRAPFNECMRSFKDRIKVRFSFLLADRAIAVSSALRKDIQDEGIRRPIDIVPNTFNKRLFSLKPTRKNRLNGQFNLLFVGRLDTEQKNLPSLLRAMQRLSMSEEAKYRLSIIGDGKLRKQYELLAKELKIDMHCRFIGSPPRDVVAREMGECDLLVLPSLFETFGVVVIEAMAVGRPVLATACGGPETMITPATGKVVLPDDDLSLVKGIRDICSNIDSFDPEAISSYAEKNFGSTAVTYLMTEIYKSVLIKKKKFTLCLKENS
jgi:glycosyltransferase involved in cell wall biosynthesis